MIGIHTPEFGFETDPANVKNAVSDLKVPYPIPIDSNHSIWRAFRNEYWPADYFVDAQGRIRYHHFGEGEYSKWERVIQTLLRENGAAGLDESTVSITADGAEAPPSRRMVQYGRRGRRPPAAPDSLEPDAACGSLSCTPVRLLRTAATGAGRGVEALLLSETVPPPTGS